MPAIPPKRLLGLAVASAIVLATTTAFDRSPGAEMAATGLASLVLLALGWWYGPRVGFGMATLVLLWRHGMVPWFLGPAGAATLPPIGALGHALLVLGAGGLGGYLYRTRLRAQELEGRLERLRGNLSREIEAADALCERLGMDAAVAEAWGIGLVMQPCGPVGGDIRLIDEDDQGRLVLAIGDVAGRGLVAALVSAAVVGAVRALVALAPSLAEVVARANEELAAWLPEGSFVTLFLARLDPMAGRLAYVNAGHNPPVLCRRRGAMEELEPTGLVLGISTSERWEERSVPMEAGDLLFCYTDGLIDLPQEAGRRLNLARLRALIAGHAHLPAAEIAPQLLRQATLHHEVKPTDDITVIVVRHQPTGSEPTRRTG